MALRSWQSLPEIAKLALGKEFFAFLGLWSRGGVFIGPLFILLGMAIITSTKSQFHKRPTRVAIVHEPGDVH